ncbi:MAG: PD-(D/E)XK nuclease family protein [Patulibacter sp.]
MPLQLLLGPAGARKTGRLLDAHQAAAAAGAPAWLVAPGSADLAQIRRELLGLEALGGVRRTPTPYADLLGAPELERRLLRLAGGPPLLSQDERRAIAQAVVATAMQDRAFQALRPGGRRGWLADELVALADELIVTGDLDGGARAGLEAWGRAGGGQRGPELAALLHDDAERRAALAAASGGPIDRATAAQFVARALRDGSLDLRGMHLTLAGFDDLDPVQRGLVVALAGCGATVLLSLPYAEDREALAASAGLVQQLRAAGAQTQTLNFDATLVEVEPALAAVGAQLFEALPEAPPEIAVVAEGAPAILELRGAGPDEELALIAEAIDDALKGGTPATRIAVVTAQVRLHGPAIVAALRRRGVAAHLAAGADAAATPIVRGTVALLRAAGAGGTAADLVAWLAVVDRDGADQLDAEIRRRDARSTLDALRLWSGRRITELDRLRDARGGRPGALELVVAEILGEQAARWAASTTTTTATTTDGRLEGGVERAIRAAGEAAQLLERRARLVRRAWALTPPLPLAAGLDDLARALEELRLEREPEPAGSIAVVGPLAVRTRTLDRLVIARAVRGSFPASESSRRILSAADRGALAADYGWPVPLQPSHGAAERYLAYELVTTPTKQLMIGWHDGDGDGGACEPSPLVAELRRVAGDAMSRRTLGAGHAALLGGVAESRDQLARAAAGPRHREFTHARSARLAATSRGHYAVRELQAASRCTAQWFVEHHLRPRPLDPDAAPLTAGRLRHDLLADLLQRALDDEITLVPGALPALQRELRAAAQRRADAATPGGETLAERLLRERVVAELEATLPALCGTAQLDHQPGALELAFGGRSEPAPEADGEERDAGRPPVVVNRAGQTLTLSGRIDRLDLSADGSEVVVVDYKGADVDPYRSGGWVERRELQAGLYALVAAELTDATPVASLYQPVPGPLDRAPRGAAVAPLSGRRLNRADVIGEAQWDALLDELMVLATEAAAAIDAGQTEPCAARCSDGGCRHPWLCRVQQR